MFMRSKACFKKPPHFCQESIWLCLEHSDVSQKPVLSTLLQTLPRLGVLLASRVLATGTLSAVKCNAVNSPLEFPMPMLISFCSLLPYNNTLFHIYKQRKNYKSCRKLEKSNKITIYKSYWKLQFKLINSHFYWITNWSLSYGKEKIKHFILAIIKGHKLWYIERPCGSSIIYFWLDIPTPYSPVFPANILISCFVWVASTAFAIMFQKQFLGRCCLCCLCAIARNLSACRDWKLK